MGFYTHINVKAECNFVFLRLHYLGNRRIPHDNVLCVQRSIVQQSDRIVKETLAGQGLNTRSEHRWTEKP